MAPHKRKTQTGILAMLALVGAALLSGCAGLGDDGNRAPTARLEADRETGWVGDEFTFDAQSSSDPDGNVTSWEFDFGDGSPKMTVTDEDAARVKHAYDDGGEYVVTVKVIDDGTGDGLEEKADEQSLRVAVDDRSPVAAQVVRTPLNTTAGSTMDVPFEVNDGADRALANLTLQNTLVAGASEVTVRILDPSGKVLEEQSVSLPDTEEKDVELSTPLDAMGDHVLEIVADSGSARVTGELQSIYSDQPDPDEESDEMDG